MTSRYDKPIPFGWFALEYSDQLSAGEVKPLVAATYDLKDFVEGQKAFIEKRHTGNIVVTT